MAWALRLADPDRLAETPVPSPDLDNRILAQVSVERRQRNRGRLARRLGIAAAAAVAGLALVSASWL